MQFTLLQHGEDINADHHIRVLVRKDQWDKWYKEQTDRMIERSDTDKMVENCLARNKPLPRTFDVDECQEIGVIGIEHLQELLSFLANNK